MAESVAGNRITDVRGVRVGHDHRLDLDSGWATGTTVVLVPEGAAAAVDVRGGGPGTRETDALSPGKSVTHIHAIVLSGGSAFGLSTADGVMQWLEEHDYGAFSPHWNGVVPIVPAAVLFDLSVGSWTARPDAQFGYRAAQCASVDFSVGSVGAGTGAVAGVVKGGVGTASEVVASPQGASITLGALVVVNSEGSVFDPQRGRLWGENSVFEDQNSVPVLSPSVLTELNEKNAERKSQQPLSFNTTLGVVAVDADISREGCLRVAGAAHNGIARAIRPSHGPFDGDTIFALATKRPHESTELSSSDSSTSRPLELAALGDLCEAAARCVEKAIVQAIMSATCLGEYQSFSRLAQ